MCQREWLFAVCLLFGSLVFSGCKKSTEQSLGALARAMQKEAELTPQLEVAVNVKALREAEPIQKLLWKNRKALTVFFTRGHKQKPGCDMQGLLVLVDKVSALFLADFQVIYAVVEGPFEPNKALKCFIKDGAKPIKVLGRTITPSTDGYWWAAGKHRLIGVIENEDTNNFFTSDTVVSLDGSDGLMNKILEKKGLLAKGLSPRFDKDSVVFRVSSLDKMKMPRGAGFLRPESVVGSFSIGDKISYQLKVRMATSHAASTIMKFVNQARRLVPQQSASMNIKRSSNTLVVDSSVPMGTFVQGLENGAKKLAKFVHEAREKEVRNNLLTISEAAVMWYKADHRDPNGALLPRHFPGASSPTGIVDGSHTAPAAKPCAHGKPNYPDNFAEWNKQPWKSLRFHINGKHPYQYVFTTSGSGRTAEFTVRAHADLDCDGILSTYEMRGSIVVRSGEVFLSKIVATQPNE